METSAEIVAKKLWHRGGRATARDLFELALVIEREPKVLARAGECLVRHREVFLSQLEQRKAVLKLQFDAIDRLDYGVTYGQAQRLAGEFSEGASCTESFVVSSPSDCGDRHRTSTGSVLYIRCGPETG